MDFKAKHRALEHRRDEGLNLNHAEPELQIWRTGSETLPELAGGTPAIQEDAQFAAIIDPSGTPD